MNADLGRRKEDARLRTLRWSACQPGVRRGRAERPLAPIPIASDPAVAGSPCSVLRPDHRRERRGASHVLPR